MLKSVNEATSTPDNGELLNGATSRRKGTNLIEDFVESIERRAKAGSMPPLPASAYIAPSVSEGASPWLDEYIQFSRRWSPRSYEGFHEAVGLWLLSTVAARRVALHFGKKRYTSLYVALATPTSIHAKSTATEVATGLLRGAGLTYLLGPDDATPQAFVSSLAGHLPADWAEMPREKQLAILERIASAGQRGWFFDEFGQKVSAMMREGGHMADFRGLLRKFDDTPDDYEYVSIGRGRDRITAPYLALLANLTPADLRPYADKGAALWGDGFWARFAFITAPPDTPGSRARFPDGERISPPGLVSRLKAWHKRLGIPKAEVKEQSDTEGKGKARFEVVVERPDPRLTTLGDGVTDAYYRYADSLLDLIEQSPNQDLAGNYTRLPEKALRVSMLLGSLENYERIDMRHWARGQQIAESWRQSLHWLYDDVTRSKRSKAEEIEDKIINLLDSRGPLTKREICQNIAGLDSVTAGLHLASMCKAGLIELKKRGKADVYSMPGQSVEV